jgi:hypothetical protein
MWRAKASVRRHCPVPAPGGGERLGDGSAGRPLESREAKERYVGKRLPTSLMTRSPFHTLRQAGERLQ